MRALRLPALEAALAGARQESTQARGMAGWLAATFGLEGTVPHAAISLSGEGLPREGTWLHADPVHLRIGQDAVALHDASALGLSREEANALVAALQRHFESDQLVFLSPAPDRWYVRVPEEEVPATTPLDDALGRNIFGLLPRGAGRFNWPAAVTEAQMLFSTHPVNEARESQRRATVNGVWFWGEGTAPASVAHAYDAVHGGDAFARGLAKLSGAGRTLEGERVLVILDAAAAAVRAGVAEDWIVALREAERDWFSRLDALRARYGSVRLVVPGANGTRLFTLRRPRLLSFLTRPKPLADHA